MIKRRRRVKHEKTFQERLAEEAQRYKEAAKHLPPGTARELLLRRARQADTAANIDAWLASPGYGNHELRISAVSPGYRPVADVDLCWRRSRKLTSAACLTLSPHLRGADIAAF
ncbi:hypothetical protein [Bradyrhizobium sp. LMTR 3]|uniref:hypothetical protein n=1 Tax=Bradyrhizobium sp. LMTR 3 TaxID=189873 RepID=UPI0032E4F0FB